METEIQIYTMMLDYITSLCDDFSEEEFCKTHIPGGNPPAWIVGHLTIYGHRIAEILNQPSSLPDQFDTWFGKGTSWDHSISYPTKADIQGAHRKAHEIAIDAIASVTEEVLETVRTEGFYYQKLPKIRDAITFLMTSHESIHAGQLSMQRRASGKPPLN